MRDIQTRWHRVRDAVKAGRIKLAALQDGLGGGDVAVLVDRSAADRLLDELDGVPRFVVAAPVITVVSSEQALLSISDMMTCGMLHLPFERCVVEFTCNGVDYCVAIEEAASGDGKSCWRASAFGYRGKMLKDDAALLFPGRICLSVDQPDEAPFDTDVKPPGLPVMDYSVEPEVFLRAGNKTTTLLEDAHPLAFDRCVTAFLAAMLLPRTLGLDREDRGVKASLNKARTAHGKSPIPSYTFITVGAVDAGNEATATGRRSPVTMHLRRAHKKRVVVGAGRTGRVWRFIPAQVVGRLPDGRKPTVPEMLATRATRPYLLK